MATCKYCEKPIKWKKSKKGKWYAIDNDGQFHSKTCAKFPTKKDEPQKHNEDAACSSPCGEEPMGCSSCDRMGPMSNNGYYNY